MTRKQRYAKKRVKEVLAFEKCRFYMPDDIGRYDWEVFQKSCAGKKVIAILSDKLMSYKLLDGYYSELRRKNINLVEVLQDTYEIVEKEVQGFQVMNLYRLSELDVKECVFLCFELQNYEYIKTYLLDYTTEIYNIYALEISKFSLERRKMLRKIYRVKACPFVVQYLKIRTAPRTDCWKDFKAQCAGKKIFIFGTGEGLKRYQNQYLDDFPVVGAIDNDATKWGKELEGIRIYGPSELEKYNKDEVVVLVTVMSYQGILNQLNKMGISKVFVYPELEANRMKYKIKCCSSRISRRIWGLTMDKYFRRYRFLPIKKNKIVVIRHAGKGYGCHSKYIVQELMKREKKYEIVWLVNDIYEKFPDGVKKVELNIKNRVYHMASAHIWLNNDVLFSGVRKRKKQIYINTWHGTGISLKKFYLDVPDSLNESTKERVHIDAELADIYLAASKSIAEIYHTAFDYHKEIVISGSPRVDILVQDDVEVKKQVRKKLGLSDEQRLVLYAPTYRKEKQTNASIGKNHFLELNIERLKEVLQKKFGGEWVFSIRLHPVAKKVEPSVFENLGILNLTYYSDVQEILLAADVLITDYSSIMFEMGYAYKKVFLFAPDVEEYVEDEKMFYINMTELPFSLGKNQKELEEAILAYQEQEYVTKLRLFNQRFAVREDGKASARVVDLILGYIEGE